MPAVPKQSAKNPRAIEIKSTTITLPILRLTADDLQSIDERLGKKISEAPDFFRNAPIVVDLTEIAALSAAIEIPDLLAGLRRHRLVPVGVQGGNEELNARVLAENLAVLPERSTAQPTRAPKPDKPQSAPRREESPQEKSSHSSTMLVTQPIRSGQRIYATSGDMVVLTQVSAGAEIMADGNIHVYGTLRGRALAGVQGDTASRIFCKDMQAELVSVAGHYRISENMQDEDRGKPVQIYLQDQALLIETL